MSENLQGNSQVSMPLQTKRLPKQKADYSENGFSQPILYNCIHCEEEYIEKKDNDKLDFNAYDGIKNIDKKDYRLCQECVNDIISDLQAQIIGAGEEILYLQEKSEQVKSIIEQSKQRFQPEDVMLLSGKEVDLNNKIKEAEQQSYAFKKEIVGLQNVYCNTLKEEEEQLFIKFKPDKRQNSFI